MNSNTRDLYVRGVAAAKAGDIAEAYFYFKWLLRLSPPIQERIDSYYWLSEIENSPEKALEYVKEMLLLDASEPRARRKLAVTNGELKQAEIISADRFKQPGPSRTDVNGVCFICSRCGGRLSFNPELQSLVCDYCQVVTESKTNLDLQSNEIPEDNFIATLATAKGHIQPVSTKVVHCQGCNVSFLISPGVLSRSCPFCFTNYVLDIQKEEDVIIPNGIIPFHVSLKQAKLALNEWLENHLDMANVGLTYPILGAYIPVWTFDINGVLNWEATVEEYGSSERRKGEKPVYYDDYLMLGTVRVSSVLHAALCGFDLHAMLPFNESYLADWPAEIFQISLADASLTVRHDILAKERGEIERGLEQRTRNLTIHSTKMYIEAFRLVLMPVWMSEYEINHKGYKVVINGQTGCVYGILPKSAHKSWISDFLGI